MGGCEEPQSGSRISLHSKFIGGGGERSHLACVSEHTVLKKKFM